MQLTLEEKLKYVKMHLFEHVPIYEIEEKYHLDQSRLKYFIQLYEKYGEKAFSKETSRRKYSREEKLKAIKQVKETGISYRKLAVELMLSDPTILADWVHKYDREGEAGIKDTYSREAYKHHDDKILEKEYKKLLEDLERTKAENEYLKKSFPQALKRSKQSKKK